MKKVQDLIKKFGFIVIVFSVFIMTLTSSKVQAAEVTITRAQWLHDLTQLFGITVKQDDYPDNYFNDIDSEDEYYQDIMTAAEFGLVDIEAGEKVRPADPVTREFAVYTMNLCMGYTANAESTYDFDDQSEFIHVNDEKAAEYFNAAQVAIDQGWVELEENKFMPQKNLTLSEKNIMWKDAADYLNSQVIDENYVNKIKDIMDQALFHSVLDEENFKESVYLLKNRLLAQMDDPANLSCMYAFEMAHDKHPISIPVQGSLKDLETLTLKDVKQIYTLYMDMAKHFYICGYVDQELYDFIDSLDSHCPFISERTLLPKVETSYKTFEKDISQTCISQVYSTSVDISSADYEAELLLCSILGQSQKNLMFDEIREKNSLCYSISSSIIRFDGAILIHTGVNRKDVTKVLNLIETQMDRLLNMDYDDAYLEIAKMGFKDRIIGGLDQALSLIAQAFLDDLLHRKLTTEQRIERIMKVTKEDISRVALQMNLASVAIVAENENEL